MTNTVSFFKLTLSEDEIYVNMDSWVSSHTQLSETFVYKEKTSFYNPTLLLSADFLEVSNCNYAMIKYDDGVSPRPQVNYFFIEDVRTCSNDMLEVDLKFDAFRSCPWRNAETKIQLLYSTRENDWSTTCDEPRFDPYAPQAVFLDAPRGMRRNKFTTGIRASDDGNNDVSGIATQSEAFGVYLVNWYWGNPNVDLGMVWGAFDSAEFNHFISDVVDFVNNNPGAILHGDLDYTKWIISAKWFPSLSINEFTTARGWYRQTGLGVGGLASANCTCYMRRNSPGVITGYGGIRRGPYEVLTGTSDITIMQKCTKLKFLLQDKWSKMIVSTPVGIGEIPLERLRLSPAAGSDSYQATSISVFSQIDLASGTMRIVFDTDYNDGYMGTLDTLLSLSGPISMDVMDRFTHVASDREVVTMALPDIANGIISGAANGGGAIGGILGGATGLVNKMTSPRRYNIHVSGQGDIKYLAANSMSLKEFTVNTFVYLNEDTPIWDSQNVIEDTGWNANRVYTSYTNWCKQMHHGFPSIKWINCSGLAPSAPEDEMYIRAQQVSDVYVYNYPHWCEEEIARKLLQGVVLKTYS